MSDSLLVDAGNRFGVLQQAQSVFDRNPHWSEFYSDILSPEGRLYRAFPTKGDRDEFKRSPEYAGIMEMSHRLLQKEEPDGHNGHSVITIRLPKQMHSALRHEAFAEELSLNKLCILRLLGG